MWIPSSPSKWKRRRLARLIVTHTVLAKWSFFRLKFLQIPLLIVCWITELRSLASKTKVSSNWLQKRKGKPSSTNLVTFRMWRQTGKIKEFSYGTSCTGPCMVFLRQSRWHAMSLECAQSCCERTTTDRVIYVSWLLKHIILPISGSAYEHILHQYIKIKVRFWGKTLTWWSLRQS